MNSLTALIWDDLMIRALSNSNWRPASKQCRVVSEEIKLKRITALCFAIPTLRIVPVSQTYLELLYMEIGKSCSSLDSRAWSLGFH